MALRVGKKVSLRRRVTPQRVAAAERRRASFRRLSTTVIVLLFLGLIGAGTYTWYMGQQKTLAAESEEPTPSRRVELKPVRQDPNANVGVSVQVITSPVKPGENASVSIRTNQLADCTISVKYGDVTAADSGLVKKKADEFGLASWAWTVAPDAPEGAWPVRITCANQKKSGMVEASLVVKAG